MLYIKKQNPPASMLAKVNEIKRSDEWRQIPDGDTDAIRNQFDMLPKDVIRQSLVREQHGLCAYCMCRIADDGRRTTVEHWYPLSKRKNGALEYSNMLGVCHGGRITALEDNGKRVLCCDARKGEQEITIDPRNERHMRDIAYMKNGIIYTISGDEALEDDINNKLCLNGLADKQGNRIDTATEIIKGRRDAAAWCDSFYKKLDRAGKCTSAMIQKMIVEINEAEIMPEYAGVKLFFLRKKYNELLHREQKGIQSGFKK
jgi:uncharacterized protein (TIGR02646 family)